MQIHDPNLHLKLIEMCDCYLETNYQNQIQRIADGSHEDPQEAALTYLALAIMYAITERAAKLTFKQKKGELTVTIKGNGEKKALRAPGPEVFSLIIAMMRNILHLEDDKGSLPLSLGLRNGQLEIQVKVERKEDKETLKLKFPNQD